MSLERSAARAQTFLTLLALIGILVAVAGGVMLSHALAHGYPMPGFPGRDGPKMYDSAEVTVGSIVTGTGVLIAIACGVVSPFLSLAFRRAVDDRWRYEQMIGAVENQRLVLESIRDSGALSDAAKQIAYRHKDREALRKAIQEDLEKQDYEAARALVDEMDRRFGYREEGAELREQIEAARRTATETRVRESVAGVEDLIGRKDFNTAQKEADKLVRLYPERPELRRVLESVNSARESHKRDLLKAWKEAAAKDDVDRSVEYVRQLDAYLSPSEAEAYKEMARDVFKKKLQQLGVQFALHVHDKNWNEALRIGKQITDEFPNTRIAAEVKERMPILKEKAGQLAGV